MRGPFRLYPEERHWWSMADYGAVLDVMQEGQPKRVLEFGPGSSTLALIEGGAQSIDTCEDNPDWAEVYQTRLVERFPDVVRLHRYTWSESIQIPALDGQRFDLALIDGPLGTPQRPPVIRYAMARCDAVLVPTEDLNPNFRQILKDIARDAGWRIQIRETGPLSGGFALMQPPEPSQEPPKEEPSETAAIDPADLSTPERSLPITDAMVRPEALTTRRKGRRRGRNGGKA